MILPSAGWCEDDGTFTNSERRVNRVRRIRATRGAARPNWWIFKEIARRMGHNWESPGAREIWDNEISRLVPAMAGITYHRIEGDGLQWPCPSIDHPGTPVLHTGGKFTRGKGLLLPIDWSPPGGDHRRRVSLRSEHRSAPVSVLPAARSSRSVGINHYYGEETADISPADATELGIAPGERILVRSRRGEVRVPARITGEVPKGFVWMSFHFRKGNSNWLTMDAFDPETQTAEYKSAR